MGLETPEQLELFWKHNRGNAQQGRFPSKHGPCGCGGGLFAGRAVPNERKNKTEQREGGHTPVPAATIDHLSLNQHADYRQKLSRQNDFGNKIVLTRIIRAPETTGASISTFS